MHENAQVVHQTVPRSEGGSTTVSADMEKRPSISAVQQPRMDKGVACWMQVVGSFCMWANSWGVVNSFGMPPGTSSLSLQRREMITV